MPRIYNNNPKPKKSFEGLWKFFQFVFVSAISASLIYFFLVGSFFKIKSVSVEGVVLGNEAELKGQVTLGSNLFFIDKQRILQNISRNPLYEEVHVYKGLPDGIKIVVKEREAILLWQSGPKLYVLDKDGIAFMDFNVADLADPNTIAGGKLSNLPKVVDTKSVTVQSGKWVVSSSFMKFIATVQSDIAKIFPEFVTSKVEVMDTTYDVAFVSKDGMRVIFNTLGSPDVQVRNLVRLFQQKKIDNKSIVDLRINRWAYVSQ